MPTIARGVPAHVRRNLITQLPNTWRGPHPVAKQSRPEAIHPQPHLAAAQSPDEPDAVDTLTVVALPPVERTAPIVAGLTAGVALGSR